LDDFAPPQLRQLTLVKAISLDSRGSPHDYQEALLHIEEAPHSCESSIEKSEAVIPTWSWNPTTRH